MVASLCRCFCSVMCAGEMHGVPMPTPATCHTARPGQVWKVQSHFEEGRQQEILFLEPVCLV